MTRRPLLALSLLAFATALGCASGPPPVPRQKVLQPPMYDLMHYQAIGLIQFGTHSPHPELPGFTTQQFLTNLQQAQPGVRVVELGPAQQVLSAVGKSQLDPDAVKAIAAKYNVQAVFAGEVETTEAKPKVNVSSFLTSGQVDVAADVTSRVSAKLIDTASGATIWTNAMNDKGRAGEVSVNTGGGVDASGQDTNDIYARMVHESVYSLTDPFRSHWVWE